MFSTKQIYDFAKVLAVVCGGWLSLMSGAVSIPFAFLALLTEGNPRRTFALLAFAALWLTLIKTAYKCHQLSVDQNDKKQALLVKMVQCIRSKTKANPDPIMRYIKQCQPTDSIGALIKFSNEIHTENDLKWFCDQFEKSGYAHPFQAFEPVLGDKFQWLPVLNEASLMQWEIETASQFLDFLAMSWSGKEKWKQGQARYTDMLTNKQMETLRGGNV